MKRIFLVIMILMVWSTGGLSYAQDQETLEARKCAREMQSLINHIRVGGGNAGAQKYFNLPLTDFWGTNIPLNRFIDIIRTLDRQGYDFIGFDVFNNNIIRITYSNPKAYNEGRKKGLRAYAGVRIWFRQNNSGQWKISGLWRIWEDGYLEELSYR